MEGSNPVETLLPSGTYPRRSNLCKDSVDQKQYQSLVGSEMYLVIATRPDVAFSTTILSQYSSCPSKEHHNIANHSLRYLCGTTDLGLWYPKRADNVIDIYSDTSYASDPDTRRSVSGWVFFYGGALIA